MMSDGIYAFLYLFLEIANGMAVYCWLLRVCRVTGSRKQMAAGACLLLLMLFGVCATRRESVLDLVAFLCVLVFTLAFTGLTVRQGLLLCPLVYIGTAIVNTFGSFFLAWLRGCTQGEIIASHGWTLVSECTAILVCLCVWLLTRGKSERTLLRIDAKKYALLWVGVLGCGFLIAAAQCEEQGIALGTAQLTLVGLLGSAFGVVFLVVCIWQIYTYNYKERVQQENARYEEYLRMQEQYMHMLIDADANMRKFRHDFRAHALAIRGHAEEKKDAWLLSYVDEMIGASDAAAGVRYTRIAALDAIIQEMAVLAEKDGISVTWKGTLGTVGGIRIFDLCTIVSNLFMNAIEACRLVSGERSIVSEVCRYEQSVYIKMQNSCPPQTDGVGGLRSKKTDTRNHGLGLENVKKAVESYQGTLQYTFEGSHCTVEVLLLETAPVKNEKNEKMY